MAVVWMPTYTLAITFDTLSSLAYSHSENKFEADGKRQALLYDKEAISANEPLILEGSTRRIRADTTNADGFEYGAMVGFTAKNPWVMQARNAQIDAAIQTLEATQFLQRGRIQISLKRNYLLSILSKQMFEVYTQKNELAEKAYDVSLKKYQAGRVSQMEVVRFDTERFISRKERDEAQLQYQHFQDVLREESLLDQEIYVEDLSFEFLKDKNMSQILSEAPILQSYDLRQDELSKEIETLRHSRVETVVIGVGMTQEPTQNSVDMKVTIPLAFGIKNEKKIASLMALRSALSYQKEIRIQKIRMTLIQSFARLGEMERLIDESVLAQSRQETLYTIAKKGFEGGVVSLFEYLDTKNRFYNSRIETLRLKRGYVEETALMEEQLGGIYK